jgi:hypothetical protein
MFFLPKQHLIETCAAGSTLKLSSWVTAGLRPLARQHVRCRKPAFAFCHRYPSGQLQPPEVSAHSRPHADPTARTSVHIGSTFTCRHSPWMLKRLFSFTGEFNWRTARTVDMRSPAAKDTVRRVTSMPAIRMSELRKTLKKFALCRLVQLQQGMLQARAAPAQKLPLLPQTSRYSGQ